jgi:hypothetical protein
MAAQPKEAIMRKLVIPLIAALTLATFPAHADRSYHGHGSYGYRGGGDPWAGLILFSAIAGLAILAESSRPAYVDPYYGAPTYGAPLVFIEQPPATGSSANPAGYWYYCGSSFMYYPYAKVCPEGWQAVPASPD